MLSGLSHTTEPLRGIATCIDAVFSERGKQASRFAEQEEYHSQDEEDAGISGLLMSTGLLHKKLLKAVPQARCSCFHLLLGLCVLLLQALLQARSEKNVIIVHYRQQCVSPGK
jgi:hypothetical protein